MARIVVLQFEDNEEADIFVKNEGMHPETAIWTYETVGMFQMPTMFCPNSGSGGCSTGKRVRAWQRGQKFGWWVCTICKKPSGYVPPGKPNEIWRRVVSQGVNLLRAVTDQHPESVHDEGWGAYREGVLR